MNSNGKKEDQIDCDYSSKRNTEEMIINLEIYIECLQENVIIYKDIKRPSFVQKQEFLMEYINLEESILKIFDELNFVKINQHQNDLIEKLLQDFNSYWKEFQDDWTTDIWDIYEMIRKKEKRCNIIFQLEEEEKVNNEEESKNPHVEDNMDESSKVNKSKSQKDFSLGSEFKTIMKRYRRNSTPGLARYNTMQTEENLRQIDQELRTITCENSNNINKTLVDSRKNRRCLPLCCIIF